METHFWEDMRGLGNEPLDRVLRVSDLVDDLVGYIERLVSRGMAYEAKGSVYLDSKALFNRDIGDLLFAPRSEGKTQDKMEGFAADKKCDQDFALWKAEKPLTLSSEVLVTAKAHLDRVRSFLVHVNHLRQRWSSSQPTSESNPSSNPSNNYGLVASDLDGQLVDLFSLGFLSDKAIHIIFKTIEEVYKTKSSNPAPFFHLGSVVAKWFKIWGFDFSDSQTSSDSKEEELLDLVVHLREELRSLSKSSGFYPLYSLGDKIRNVYLKNLGISLEDREGLGTKRFLL